MSNYIGITRTNYFSVIDPDRLKNIIAHTESTDDAVELWFNEDKHGHTKYAFGCTGRICGLTSSYFGIDDSNDDEDSTFNDFTDELQKIVSPNDAIIITEVGFEKMRYASAISTVITSKKIVDIDLGEEAFNRAADLIGDQDWDTQMDY